MLFAVVVIVVGAVSIIALFVGYMCVIIFVLVVHTCELVDS